MSPPAAGPSKPPLTDLCQPACQSTSGSNVTTRRNSCLTRAKTPGFTLSWFGLLAAMLGLICAAVAALLHDSRAAVYRTASSELSSLSAVISQDIARNLDLYDLSIRGALEDYKLPNVMAAPLDIRRLVLFDHAASASYLGALRVIDATGRVAIDSQATADDGRSFEEADYFRAQIDRNRGELFVGQPVFSKTDGTFAVGLSRRIDNADGSFGGVVVGTLQLDYFRHLFSRMKLGPRAAVSLFRDDGTMLMRRPYDPGMIGKVFKPGMLLQRAARAHEGEYQAKSAIDGVERLIRFERIGKLPLILVVTAAVEDIYADWWRKAVAISALVAICCAVIIGLAFRLRRELARRMEAEAALGLLADEDALTGLANRRRFDAHLHRHWTAAVRSEAPLSLLLIDADRFKSFNDTFGHPAGDDALRTLSLCMKAIARGPDDLVSRFGGEEFAIVLPSTKATDALRLAERLREAVGELAISHPLSPCGHLTVSIGVATCHPQAKDQPRSLIAAADAALYEAKDEGRNKTVLGTSLTLRAA